MTTRFARILAPAVLAGLTIITLQVPWAKAETCGAEAVTARGEASRFTWLAKTKARANWRRKVRGTTGLGADFSNWQKAKDTEERCLTGPEGTVCVFTGLPCKP